jgi:hypothetical protein
MNSFDKGFGVVLTLEELRAELFQISRGANQWMVNLVEVSEPHAPGWPTLCAEIWYSNPVYTDLPNAIGYHVPAFPGVLFGDDDDAKICLHPSLMYLIRGGLYLDGDELLEDDLGDFRTFWEPMRVLYEGAAP